MLYIYEYEQSSLWGLFFCVTEKPDQTGASFLVLPENIFTYPDN